MIPQLVHRLPHTSAFINHKSEIINRSDKLFEPLGLTLKLVEPG